MNRLCIKKEKMAAHPIAEASITLPLSLSLSLCLTEGSQLGERAANQDAETESEGDKGGGRGVYLSLLLLLPECFAAAAASRLTGLLRDSHTHTYGLLSL